MCTSARSRARLPFFLSLTLLTLLSVTQTTAQEVSGTISGTVQDATGALIPNATITVTNTEKNVTLRTMQTGASGDYSLPNLPLGTYTVTAEAAGFRRSARTGVTLNVNDRLTLNFVMEVGAVTEEVRVEEAPVQVELQTAAAQSLITGTQVRELALNTRNFAQLVQLSPGVVGNLADQVYVGVSNPLGTGNTVSISINGARPGANNWTVDGADNVDRGSNQTLLNYPSVDAIAEFRVLRGQYTAEFGRSLGGQINVVTRSGANAFHGDAYEFFRNDQLSANNFFNNRSGIPRPPLRYNNFGYTFGGPLVIPRLYNTDRNKTFFFWSQEFRRVITYGTASAILPTAAQLQGNFANPVCVQVNAAGTACQQTATQITNINPAAQAYIKDIFSRVPPGAQGTGALFSALRNVANARQEMIRVDHIFGPKLTLMGRFLNDTIPTIEPGGLFTGLAVPNVATTATDAPGRSWVFRATSTFSPTLVNEGGYAYSYGAVISRVQGIISSTASPDVNIPLPFTSTIARVPSLTFTNGSSITGFGPYDDFNRNHNIWDNITKILGRHTLRFGGSYYRYEKTENAGNGNQSTFNFTGGGTGTRPAGTSAFEQAFANFLLGNVATFTQTQYDLIPKIRSNSLELYAQDDFRLRPNFTLNVGVRWSIFRAPYDANGYLTNFDPSTYDPAKAVQIDPTTGNIVPGTGDPLNGLIIVSNAKDQSFGHVSPYGKKISNENWGNVAPRIGFSWDPFRDGKTSVRAGYGIYYDTPLYGIYEQNVFNNPPFANTITIPNTQFNNPGAGTPSVNLTPKALRATPYDLHTPYAQHWSFDIQREIARGFILDVGYYGMKGTHLIGIRDINQVPPGLAVAQGIIPAGQFFTSANTPRLNALRPYKGYTAINTIETNYNQNYNSLQVGVDKRFGSNAQVGLAYTWSKNLGDTRTDRDNAPQNSYDVRAERGLMSIDRRHVLTVNYVLPLPFLRQGQGVLGSTLGGWEISGITTFQTGLPLNPASGLGNDPAGLGFLGPSSAGPRPDWVCNPNENAPHTVGQWFNTGCFAEVPAGQNRPGNAGRSTIQGPGVQRWDVSLLKNFALWREETRLQFRAEAFNVLNQTNYRDVNTTLGSAQYGQVTATRDPRILQLALKLYF